MDTNIQIQSLKSQIMNINFQLDNIDEQNKKAFMINKIQIGEQLLNLSIQILNIGIQAFTFGKATITNHIKYSEQLKLISQKINSLIYENNIPQQKMINQLMIQHPPMMIMQQNNNVLNQPQKYNVFFKLINKPFNSTVIIQEGMTVEELLNRYIDKIKDQFSNDQIKKMEFFSTRAGIGRLYRNEKRKINDTFRNATIFVEY